MAQATLGPGPKAMGHDASPKGMSYVLWHVLCPTSHVLQTCPMSYGPGTENDAQCTMEPDPLTQSTPRNARRTCSRGAPRGAPNNSTLQCSANALLGPGPGQCFSLLLGEVSVPSPGGGFKAGGPDESHRTPPGVGGGLWAGGPGKGELCELGFIGCSIDVTGSCVGFTGSRIGFIGSCIGFIVCCVSLALALVSWILVVVALVLALVSPALARQLPEIHLKG